MEPSSTEMIYYGILGLVTSMGQVFIFILCIYYLIKIGPKADSILLIAGSIISLLCIITTQVGVLHAKTWGADYYLWFNYMLQGFSFIGSLLFVIGFFILIRKVIKNKIVTQGEEK